MWCTSQNVSSRGPEDRWVMREGRPQARVILVVWKQLPIFRHRRGLRILPNEHVPARPRWTDRSAAYSEMFPNPLAVYSADYTDLLDVPWLVRTRSRMARFHWQGLFLVMIDVVAFGPESSSIFGFVFQSGLRLFAPWMESPGLAAACLYYVFQWALAWALEG